MVVDSQIEPAESPAVEELGAREIDGDGGKIDGGEIDGGETAAREIDAGVIEEARRRQRRQRGVVACVFALLAAAVAGIVALSTGGVTRPPSPLVRPSAPTWLTGPALGGHSHLRLAVSENIGPASIVNIDSARVLTVHGLGVPKQQRLWSPALYPLTPVPGGALAVVTRQDCARCTVTVTEFFIATDGSARRTARLTLTRDQHSSTPALGSTSASWVLTWPRSGHCTLRVEPSPLPAVAVPCGRVVSDTPAGLVISRHSTVMLVDPHTGQVRQRFAAAAQFDVLSRTFALMGTAPGGAGADVAPTGLTLVNLASGRRMRLRWPSTLTFGYQVFPDPHGPLVAIEFGDPGHTGGQVSDVWILDLRTGGLTHVPGFPILENLKFSGVTWTRDHRLVVLAQGGGRTAIGVWRPGDPWLRVGTAPSLPGYSQVAPLSQ